MAIGPRLEFRQAQSLVMTPQLQQAIKLLQLSQIDLAAYVEQELERNPLLEREEDGGSEANDAPSGDEGAEASELDAPEGPDMASIAEEGASTDAADAPNEADFANDFTNDSAADSQGAGLGPDASLANWSQTKGGSFDDEDQERQIAGEVTLREHLTSQIGVMFDDPVERAVATAFLEDLDESGYLTSNLADTAAKLGLTEARAKDILARLQTCEPTGVFARSLKECLALQLVERDRLDPIMARFVDNLELVGKRDIPGLMRVCGCDRDDVLDMIAEIKTLDPKPGLRFLRDEAQVLIPDVYVRRLGGGEWQVELNSDALPRLLVNTRYRALVGGPKAREDKAYLSECLAAANWLIKSLDQRATTILKVSSNLVAQQQAFFDKGIEHLRPLTLRDIASEIEMHESTVSRVTTNKYLACARGVFELKFFFTSAIASSEGGEAHSAEAVRHKIRQLIEAETSQSVLSDDKLVELLRSAGIEVARRTVAKYREAMGIASSVERRRQKMALA